MRVRADSIIYGLQRVGGISTYWHQLCLGLTRRADPAVVAHAPRRVVNPEGAAVLSRMPPGSRDTLPARVSRYLPVAAGADELLHSSYYRAPTRRRTRHVVSVYDFIYERYRTGLARRVHSLQKAAAVRRADAAICISHSTRADLLDAYPDVDPAGVFAVHLSYDADVFRPVPPGERDAGLADMALFVGARTGYKRFDLAVDAVGAAPGVRLGVVGPELSAAEREVARGKLGDRLVELGRLPNERLRAAYGSCLALLYPSEYEGFGLPLLEAMACGAPVVTNRGSSLGEVAGDAALFAADQRADDYAEALVAAGGSAERARLVALGLARCGAFSWSRMVDETVAIYRALA